MKNSKRNAEHKTNLEDKWKGKPPLTSKYAQKIRRQYNGDDKEHFGAD
jgi:hypothetical protein